MQQQLVCAVHVFNLEKTGGGREEKEKNKRKLRRRQGEILRLHFSLQEVLGEDWSGAWFSAGSY